MKAAEILLIAPDFDLYHTAKRLQGCLDIRFDVKHAFLETAVDLVAMQSEMQGIKVIVSRGATMRLLRESDLEIALIDIKMTDLELLRVLSNAKKISNRIAVVGFLAPFVEQARLLSGLLDFELDTYIASHGGEIQNQVRKAIENGNEVIVGVEAPCRYALEMGVAAMLFTTSEDIVADALREADKFLTAMKAHTAQSKQQGAILNTIKDGIVSVGRDGGIHYYNAAAGSIIPRETQNISEVFGPEILPLIECGENTFGEIITVGKENFVLNISPILVEQEHTDTIISFSILERLREAEYKTRLKLASNNFTAKYQFSDILTQNEAMCHIMERCKQYAHHDSTVLISGESGTGKEMIAQSVHNASPRKFGPFVAINCAALPENLLESELFGYADGAFTGAKKKRQAWFFRACLPRHSLFR